MTAKEILNKRKFNPDEPIALSESEVEDLMNEYARHIAEQAVDEMRTRVDVNVLDAWDRGYNAGIIEAMKILSRKTNQLTQ